jgi:hypothetical protein
MARSGCRDTDEDDRPARRVGPRGRDAQQEPQRLAWLVLALGLSAASLLVEKTGVSLGPFNHNDVCHVLLTAALWPFYRIGLGLRDHGGPIGGQSPLA